MDSRRREILIGYGSALLIGLAPQVGRPAQIIAVRIWPAQSYTRITIEHDTEGLGYATQLLKDPLRFVVDLEGIGLTPVLRELSARISADDPYVRAIRVGQYQPKTIRIVFELKQEINPQIFSLPAVAQYRPRLVMDLYPTVDEDPLLTFLAGLERERALPPGVARSPEMTDPQRPAPSARTDRRPVVSRLVTIALDPGHGGEDPGAIGRRGTLEKEVVLAIAQRLKRLLDDEPNMRAYLTRDGDYFVPLHVRVQRAQIGRAHV